MSRVFETMDENVPCDQMTDLDASSDMSMLKEDLEKNLKVCRLNSYLSFLKVG